MSSSTDLAHPELKGKEVWIVDPTWDPVAKQILQYNPKGDGTYPIVRELLTGLGIIKGKIISVKEVSNELFSDISKTPVKRICDALYDVTYSTELSDFSEIETYVHIEIQRTTQKEWNGRLLFYRGLVHKKHMYPVKSIGLLSTDYSNKISTCRVPLEVPIFSGAASKVDYDSKVEDVVYNIDLEEVSEYLKEGNIKFLDKEMNPVGKAWLRLLASRFMFLKMENNEKTGEKLDEPLYKYIYNGNETDAMISILSIIGKDNAAKLNEEFRKITFEFIKRQEFIDSVKGLMEKYKMSAEMATNNRLSKLGMSDDDVIDILKSDYIPRFISSKKAPPEDEKINSTE